jgi:uncharacterized metal-binding protein YceD (DUF177 family)
MAPLTDIVDLGQLGLKPGGGIRFEAAVPVGDFKFSDQRYSLSDDPVPVTVDVTRTSSGNVIRVRLTDSLNGPCMRCFGDYSLPLAIDHDEIHEPHLDEDLASEYVDGLELDLAALVRDAIGLALPTSISSPVDENGVCIECEHSEEQLAKLRDTDADEEEPHLDPRWAKLRELEL